MRSKRDGTKIAGSEGVITAEQQAVALGLDKIEPKPARLPLTPAQAARKARGEWIGEDLDPPDYEASVVDDPHTIANVLGLRPQDFDTAPLGSQPEGMPIPQPGIRPKFEPRPEPDAVSARSRTITAEEADELRAAYRAHVEKIREIAEAARGDAAKEARAAEQVRESAELGERLKAKLGGEL